MRFWGLFLLLGCAATQASTAKDSPFSPPDAGHQASDTRQDAFEDDPGGDADFREIVGKAFAPDVAKAMASLQSFLEHHPRHTKTVPVALLLARLKFAQGDASGCLGLLGRYATGEEGPDRTFVRGLCENRLGNTKQALPLLQPFAKAGPPPIVGMTDSDGPMHLHLALADIHSATGDKAAAMDQLGLYAVLPGQGEKELAYAREHAEAMARSFTNEEALAAIATPRVPLTRAVLGDQATLALRARGDETGARRVEQDTLNQRQQLGFRVALAWAGPGDVSRFGLAVPLSGPQGRLGDVIVRGASMILFNENYGGPTIPYKLMVRDSAATADRSEGQGGAITAVTAVTALIREESSLGVITGFDPRSIEVGIRDKVPLLILDERAPGQRTTAFQMIHAADSRAAALATRSLSLGAKRFAILGPDTPAGKRLAAAFKRTVEGAGGTLTGQVLYPPSATSFVAHIENLRKLSFDALFIPDDANRLELIAPALAVADIWPRQPKLISNTAREAGNAGRGRRETFLLSTALGLSPKLLQNAERYVQGALMCPGFYPSEDSHAASFVTRFRENHGQSPSAADAYAFDAVSILRIAVERGAKTRADVLRLLSTETFEGITGDIRFGVDHARVDQPIVYVVSGNAITPLK